MNNFEQAPTKKEFISNRNEPILAQIKNFAPGKNPDFTALKYLTESEDIKAYFAERTAQIKEEDVNDQIPAETLRNQLAYIANYGEDFKKGWERFKKILETEIGNAINTIRGIQKNQ